MTTPPVEWRTSTSPVPYPEAVRAMEQHVANMLDSNAPERVWLLEHSPLFTAGTSAREEEIPRDGPFPVHVTGRGGQVTYHGPGQRIAYVMLDLRTRGRDIRRFVRGLEEWVIATLSEFGIEGGRRKSRVGVWVRGTQGRDAKIAAIGVRVRRGITYHGISVNVDPDLSHYEGIVPCGIRDADVTSLSNLGRAVAMREVDQALEKHFERTMSARSGP